MTTIAARLPSQVSPRFVVTALAVLAAAQWTTLLPPSLDVAVELPRR